MGIFQYFVILIIIHFSNLSSAFGKKRRVYRDIYIINEEKS